jgi:hypothetical protein
MFLSLFQYFMIYDEQQNREIKKKTTKIFYFNFFEELLIFLFNMLKY